MRIVDFHNSSIARFGLQGIHFNAYVETTKPMGCEVLYCTAGELAGDVSAAIADAGDFIDRGAKKRTDLFFLKKTAEPAILIETCFVDSEADAELYRAHFELICDSIADALGGPADVETEPPPGEVTPPERPPQKPPTLRLDVEVVGDITIIINGVPVA